MNVAIKALISTVSVVTLLTGNACETKPKFDPRYESGRVVKREVVGDGFRLLIKGNENGIESWLDIAGKNMYPRCIVGAEYPLCREER